MSWSQPSPNLDFIQLRFEDPSDLVSEFKSKQRTLFGRSKDNIAKPEL